MWRWREGGVGREVGGGGLIERDGGRIWRGENRRGEEGGVVARREGKNVNHPDKFPSRHRKNRSHLSSLMTSLRDKIDIEFLLQSKSHATVTNEPLDSLFDQS